MGDSQKRKGIFQLMRADDAKWRQTAKLAGDISHIRCYPKCREATRGEQRRYPRALSKMERSDILDNVSDNRSFHGAKRSENLRKCRAEAFSGYN